MAQYRITFESKKAGGAEDAVTVSVRGEIDGAPVGIWSTTVSGPQWQLEIRRPDGRSSQASEEATTRAVAEFVALGARGAIVDVDPAEWQEWAVQHAFRDRSALTRNAAELDAKGTVAPVAGDELDSFIT